MELSQRRWHRTRATTLGAATTLLALGAAGVAWVGFLHELHRLERRGAIRTMDALPVLLWAALLLALLWAALLVAMATLSLARGRHGEDGAGARPGHGPHGGGLVSRLAGVLLAVTALSSLTAATPAFATTAPTASSTPSQASHGDGLALSNGVSLTDSKAADTKADSCPDAPTPGWVPDKPTRTDQVARECAPLITGKPVADKSGEVVVRRGDTLWSIAAAHLGPHADAQEVAAEWPRWYAANRDVIGDDPDLIMTGIRLRTPTHALEGSTR